MEEKEKDGIIEYIVGYSFFIIPFVFIVWLVSSCSNALNDPMLDYNRKYEQKQKLIKQYKEWN